MTHSKPLYHAPGPIRLQDKSMIYPCCQLMKDICDNGHDFLKWFIRFKIRSLAELYVIFYILHIFIYLRSLISVRGLVWSAGEVGYGLGGHEEPWRH